MFYLKICYSLFNQTVNFRLMNKLMLCLDCHMSCSALHCYSVNVLLVCVFKKQQMAVLKQDGSCNTTIVFYIPYLQAEQSFFWLESQNFGRTNITKSKQKSHIYTYISIDICGFEFVNSKTYLEMSISFAFHASG